jgi:hypothetical protein
LGLIILIKNNIADYYMELLDGKFLEIFLTFPEHGRKLAWMFLSYG